MAKWGEGDPRWLVEERPDATNVNNWHWTEKNASEWSRNKFLELFIGMKIETEFGSIEIAEVSKCDGYAVINNRKAKLIFFYEWEMEMKWKGYLSYSEVAGKIAIRNLSDDVVTKDIDIIVTTNMPQANVHVLNTVTNVVEELIPDKFSVYVTALKEEFSKDVILPSNAPISETPVIKMVAEQHDNLSVNVVQQPCDTELESLDFSSTEIFKCSAAEFYTAMTTRELAIALTRDDCILNPTVGGKFELFGGNVTGYFTKLEPFKTISMKWRLVTWPDVHYSDVIITISEKSDCTEVKLDQFGIPKGYLDNTSEGWKNHYWDNMRKTLGFGAFLL